MIKKSFKNMFNINLEKKNGPNNSILLDKTEFVRDQKGNVSIMFKGEKIGNVNKNLEPKLFIRKNKKYVNEFNDIMKKAIKEYKKTPAALVEQQMGESFELDVLSDIVENSIEKVSDTIDSIFDDIKLSKQYVRKLAGVLDPKEQ